MKEEMIAFLAIVRYICSIKVRSASVIRENACKSQKAKGDAG